MEAQRFGVFTVHGLHLSLSLEALQEVIPNDGLCPVASQHPAVIGGISLRGVVVPVLHPAKLFCLEMGNQDELSCIVIIQHQQQLVGMLASGVGGVVASDTEVHALGLATGDTTPSLICGGFTMPDGGQPVSVLSAEAIMALPMLPRAHYTPGEASLKTIRHDYQSHMVLMKSNGIPLALQSVAVHTIILNPVVQHSAMTAGYCLGTLAFSGSKVPVLALTGMLGLPMPPKSEQQQAFIVHYDEGYVAFMVEEIIDVVRLNNVEPIALPGQAFLRGELFSGAIPTHAVPTDSRGHAAISSGYYLQINEQALKNHHEMITLARNNTTADDPSRQSAGSPLLIQEQESALATQQHCQLITYSLGAEVASPITQVMEIMPWNTDTMIIDIQPGRAGLAIAQQHAMPVYCLASLLSMPRPARQDTASIMVIELDGQRLGLAVSALISIEEGYWKTETATSPKNTLPKVTLGSHVMVGKGRQERLLTMLDLPEEVKKRLPAQQTAAIQ